MTIKLAQSTKIHISIIKLLWYLFILAWCLHWNGNCYIYSVTCIKIPLISILASSPSPMAIMYILLMFKIINFRYTEEYNVCMAISLLPYFVQQYLSTLETEKQVTKNNYLGRTHQSHPARYTCIDVESYIKQLVSLVWFQRCIWYILIMSNKSTLL